MKLSWPGLRLCKGLLIVLTVGYGVFLAWQERHFRESLASPLPGVTPVMASPANGLLDTTSVAAVFGLTAETALLPSAEPLTLQASFVLGSGLSKALLADAQGSRLYQVGERLPGGSVLRRVEADQVVLWNKGREERLALQPTTDVFLRRLESTVDVTTPDVSTRFLRPYPGQSE